jgi:predicted DNA-binding protein YlxM (UPF0122 family)
MSTMLKLNTPKIKSEMKRLGIDEVSLAAKWGCTRQAVYDILKRRPITQAEKFGRELNLDAKDLIINE